MAGMRLAILALCCAVLVSAEVIGVPSPGSCDGVYLCLKENDPLDCNQNSYYNRYCGEGLFCRLAGTDDPITGNPRGTCIKAALINEQCSTDNSEPTTLLSCYDPDFPETIFCDDPQSNGTGVCRYRFAYVPGEACQSDSRYENGGCIEGSCSGGSCNTIAAGASCTFGDSDPRSNVDPRCPFNQFCNNTLGDGNNIENTCQNRGGVGTWCRGSQECDPLLVCTSRGGVYENHFGGSDGFSSFQTCLEPFYGKEGDPCSSAFDCSAGHFCSSNICIKPSPFRKDFCTSNTQCQSGWLCECLYKSKGNKVTFTGAKCTESEAWDSDTINQWKDYQQCTKDTSCQDLWWRQAYPGDINYLPDSCSFECADRVGADLDELLGRLKQGQCISSAAAIFPLIALIAAIAAVLSF